MDRTKASLTGDRFKVAQILAQPPWSWYNLNNHELIYRIAQELRVPILISMPQKFRHRGICFEMVTTNEKKDREAFSLFKGKGEDWYKGFFMGLVMLTYYSIDSTLVLQVFPEELAFENANHRSAVAFQTLLEQFEDRGKSIGLVLS